MIELKLTPKGKEQEIIKQYLQDNVSEILADKINNGVKVIKENINLISKKDLNGFMKYANDEARKLAEKGTNCACVEDKTVFCWAIHYFEEDTIEGTLYNEDGTEYKPATKIMQTPKVEVKQPPKDEKKQTSLFDLMDLSTTNQEKSKEQDIEEETCEDDDENNEWTEEEKQEVLEKEEKQETIVVGNKIIDTTTGEIKESETTQTNSVDKELAIMLYTLLDGKMEVK